MVKVLSISCVFLFAAISCNTETVSRTYKTSEQYANGVSIEVEKTNEAHSHIGIFSKHNYGATKSYSYKLLIRDRDIVWNGGSGEPKALVFSDNEVFLYSYGEKFFNNDSLRKIDTTLAYESHYEVVEVFQKHIDKRYFFNLLGDDYWVAILAKDYSVEMKLHEEFIVPNDGELTLGIVR